jgi:DNA modification methylase
MVGMPWRLALALQADGWFLRCDIIWHKTNPMPESVYDRPTKAHEYVFLLAKSERYFFDAEAIKEPVSGTANARGNGVNPKERVPAGWDTREGNHDELIGRYKKPGKNSRIYVERDPTHINKGEKRDADGLKPHGRFGREPGWRSRQNESFSAAVAGLVATRNNRSVWTMSTAPFRGAHFATFPTALVRPCILAGTSERGCCAGCGVPWKRIIKKGKADREWQRVSGGNKDGEYHGTATKDYGSAKAQNASAVKARILAGMCERKTIGWAADCNCELFTEPIPCTVLDPFAGSGTTGQVALELGRRAILIELNADYIGLIKKRCGL